MSSRIRIADDAKERMRRLQDVWYETWGQRPTQEELLDRCIAYLERHQDAFLREAAWRPLDREEIDRPRSLQVPSGDDEEYHLGDAIYG